MASNIDSRILEDKEAELRLSVNSLLDCFRSCKNELGRQERRLDETRALMLDQLTDANAATVIRNLTKRIQDKEEELHRMKRKCTELEEKSIHDENEIRSKSGHIEKLSSLLLTKEERLQELEKSREVVVEKVKELEMAVETKEEACEKWKRAAQQAAEKMRDQLETLRASEEMNQDLRDLLDKQITKTTHGIAKSEATPDTSLDEAILSAAAATSATPISVVPASAHSRVGAPRHRLTTPTWSTKLQTTPLDASPRPTQTTPSRLIIEGGLRSKETLAPSKIKLGVPEVVVASGGGGGRGTSPCRLDDILVSLRSPGTPGMPATPGTSVMPATPATPGADFLESYMEPATPSTPAVTESSGSGSAHVPYPAPVPNFSALVADALDTGRVHDPVLWKYFIRECVHFYYDLLPSSDTVARNSYYNIGRTLYEHFPIIAKEGPNFSTPWTYFNTCLSSRLRNERFSKKRRQEKRGHVTADQDQDWHGAKRGRLDDT